MKSLVTWFARNPVAANFLMWLMLLAGFASWFRMRKEIFPETQLNMVSITVPYPNASPEEVEKGVVVPVEEAVQGVNGVKRIFSSAGESAGSVIVEVQPSADVRHVMADLKSRVDAIQNFAREAEKPVLDELLIKGQVLSIAVSADTDEATLRRFAEKVRDDLLTYRLPPDAPADSWTQRATRFFNQLFNGPASISQVAISGTRRYEISIEVSEETLRAYGITLDTVANAVRASSLDLPAGSVRTTAGEVLIRTQARRYAAAEFERVTVLTRPDGSVVPLRQLAKVVDGFEDVDLSTRLDGRSTVLVNVFRTGDEDTLRIVELVRDYVRCARKTSPRASP